MTAGSKYAPLHQTGQRGGGRWGAGTLVGWVEQGDVEFPVDETSSVEEIWGHFHPVRYEPQ